MANLRIHPTIGIARVGNSDKFFVGPEHPGVPANWDAPSQKFKSFKDADGKILRQAARFRVFEFDDAGSPVREITTGDGLRIEWRVHVANRKASFFSFNGQSGAETNLPYVDRATRPASAIEKPYRGRGQPEIKNKRNANVVDRRSLEIDPGEVAISAPGTLELRDSQTAAPIKLLGQVQMESDGNLLFLGGFGRTESGESSPRPIEEYANNDGWFDDVCDGTIGALVTFPDGHTEAAQSAWITVGPPDFVAGMGNVVSLYDLLWDMAVRFQLPCEVGGDQTLQELVSQQLAWQNEANEFTVAYEPSFTDHIYPILSRAFAVRDVHETERPDYHGTLPDWTRLSSRAETHRQMREAVFRRVRDPNAQVFDRVGMPRGLGDDFASLDAFEDGRVDTPSPQAFLSLTRVQYALLKAWVEGRFRGDWTFGDVRYAPIPSAGVVTPHGLDRAALENCVGGPFFPGIEVGWLIRERSLYTAAFRLREAGGTLGPLEFQAGFFSQQMALPWQADFYDCHKEDHTPEDADEKLIYMWWTAQRPDDIRSAAGAPYRRWVEPFDAAKDDETREPDDITNLARFEQMRTRWSELSFVVLDGDEHIEQN